MGRKEVKVIIPCYRSYLTESERISLLQCKRILGRYPICIIKPAGLPLQMDEIQGLEIEEFDDKWFQSVQTYNQLMLTEQFYECFLDYAYILIYQLDAFVFQDELHAFCSLGYDYIGAPWLDGRFVYVNGTGGCYYVGNGGLSLRKVETHLEILKKIKIDNIVTEDLFFSSREQDGFCVAPIEIALQFAFETRVRQCFERNNGKMPFGCHAWQKYDFAFYQPVFEEFGYDISGICDGKRDQIIYNNKTIDYSKLSAKSVKDAVQSLLPNMADDIWIWGSGNVGKECGWLLQSNNVHIKGFIDKNVQLHGTKLFGREIKPITMYFEETGSAPLVVAMAHIPDEVIELLHHNDKIEGRDYITWGKLRYQLTFRSTI